MDKRDVKNVFQDTTLNLSAAQRKEVMDLAKRIATQFRILDTNPDVAFIALLNVMGSLIGTALSDDILGYTTKVQAYLPLYVEAYRSREKKI